MLSNTANKQSQVIEKEVKALYAANGAQEWALWLLTYGSLMDRMEPDEENSMPCNVCGKDVDVTLVMRALESEGGLTLATDDKIKPTKTVWYSGTGFEYPDPVPSKQWLTYTYTITLEQMSEDASQGLDAIYDIPPKNFGSGYPVAGSYQISMDGGSTWQSIPAPYWDSANVYLKWPADYNKDTGTGAFSSDPDDTDHYFHGLRDFTPRQKKMIRFQIYGRLNDNDVHCNWMVLKPWNTLSGPQAPITVGNGDGHPGECLGDQVVGLSKTSYPELIEPGVIQDITYTIRITNLYTQTRSVQDIIDYLPPGFEYDHMVSSAFEDPSGTCVISEPTVTTETINGVDRRRVWWTTAQFPGGIDISLAAQRTLTLTFIAQTTTEISGSYYNEVLVFLKESGLTNAAFAAAGVTPAEYGVNYSWNTGVVLVPFYDSRTDADEVVIDSNIAIVVGGIAIRSWQVY